METMRRSGAIVFAEGLAAAALIMIGLGGGWQPSSPALGLPASSAASMPAAPAVPPPPPPLPTPAVTPGPVASQVSAVDGMVQVYVPAGEFLMGSADSDPGANGDEKPQHTVYLDAFWIDKTEVTNAMAARFVADTGYRTRAEREGSGIFFDLFSKDWRLVRGADWRHPRGPASDISGMDDHPVVQVTWSDAKAYCEWAGRRLPAEAEWEKAARGTDGRRYPWGNQPPAGTLLNFADRNLDVGGADTSTDDGYQFTAPVGSYPDGASPYGALDMAGNVWEYVADWYGASYYAESPARNPSGPPSGTAHVLRGGSWSRAAGYARAASRLGYAPDNRDGGLGFRCASAAPALPSTCTVCPAGGCDYADIQAAVDDPGCQEIKVAQGMYTGVQARPVPAGYPVPPASGLITQVLYISRSVTVRGGYSTADWATSYPFTQPTTLDAEGLGRVLMVAGDISPTIEGLSLINGNAARAGGLAYRSDSGGGVYVISATATLSACRVLSNSAEFGGGLALWHSAATLSANSVTANTAKSYGGGLYLYFSPATLSANRVTANTAELGGGGGLLLHRSPALLSANAVTTNTAPHGGGLDVSWSDVRFISNTVAANIASSYGGGLRLQGGNAALVSNSVAANSAFYGGGLYLVDSPATLSANAITANTATADGGGLYLGRSPATLNANAIIANAASYGGGLYLANSPATFSADDVTSNSASYGGGLALERSDSALTNTVVADNRGSGNGSGLYILHASRLRLAHTTIARNGGGDGSGLTISEAGSSVWLTNTVLVSHTVGISVAAGSTVAMNGTLWYGNAADWGGAGTIIHGGDYTGDPVFVDPDRDDYHIELESAAINTGVAAGVATDKDGRSRDAHPDLGAYEFGGLYLPAVLEVFR